VVADPGIQRPIESYGTPEITDKMRWAYLSRGRNRLVGHSYPKNPDRRSFLDSFNSFDNDMLVELATIYSDDFSSHD
jgi:hypothetical protein